MLRSSTLRHQVEIATDQIACMDAIARNAAILRCTRLSRVRHIAVAWQRWLRFAHATCAAHRLAHIAELEATLVNERTIHAEFVHSIESRGAKRANFMR